MAKEFTDVTFQPARFRSEVDRFRDLLGASRFPAERDVHDLFKACPHLTAYIGTLVGSVGIAKQVAHEFDIFGDYRADIVLGSRDRQFCFVEVESGGADAILKKVPNKATKEWSREFEHGFGQLIDWFCHLGRLQKDGSVSPELRLRAY